MNFYYLNKRAKTVMELYNDPVKSENKKLKLAEGLREFFEQVKDGVQ